MTDPRAHMKKPPQAPAPAQHRKLPKMARVVERETVKKTRSAPVPAPSVQSNNTASKRSQVAVSSQASLSKMPRKNPHSRNLLTCERLADLARQEAAVVTA